MKSNRDSIYYWKCDRASAITSTKGIRDSYVKSESIEFLQEILDKWSGKKGYTLRNINGQGNHLTYLANNDEDTLFVRIENGTEGDRYLDVESRILGEVKRLGVSTPNVILVDSSRKDVPFSYQIMEYLAFPDLNALNKSKKINLDEISKQIGISIAKYQACQPKGFGLFDSEMLIREKRLTGLHQSYLNYFFLNWDRHLSIIEKEGLLQRNEISLIQEIVQSYKYLLNISQGVLVHKDMALWNILGTQKKIKAIIDWDDAISGDPTDDISLIGCFHSGRIVKRVVDGYSSIKKVPDDFVPRFWLHLLRNMVVKAVIRIQGNYFNMSDEFFLIEPGENGSTLKEMTRLKIEKAFIGLKENLDITEL